MNFDLKDCFVLDGGLGMELEKKFYPKLVVRGTLKNHTPFIAYTATYLSYYAHFTVFKDDPLWSARFLHSNPGVLEEVHLNFMRAGADIVISSSYQVGSESKLFVLNRPVTCFFDPHS